MTEESVQRDLPLRGELEGMSVELVGSGPSGELRFYDGRKLVGSADYKVEGDHAIIDNMNIDSNYEGRGLQDKTFKIIPMAYDNVREFHV